MLLSRVIPTMLSLRGLNKVISRFYSKGPNNSRQHLPNLANRYLSVANLNGINQYDDNGIIKTSWKSEKIDNKEKYCNNSGPSVAVN